MKPIDRFKQKYLKTSCGCWLWLEGTTKVGYGKFSLKGKAVSAHRASYQFFKGEIPEGLNVNHKCGHSLCVNPKHLYVGTQAENIADKVKHGTHISGAKHYLYGRQFPKHTREAALRNIHVKFSAEEVKSIRKDYDKGTYGMKQLASKYGGCVRHISRIARRIERA